MSSLNLLRDISRDHKYKSKHKKRGKKTFCLTILIVICIVVVLSSSAFIAKQLVPGRRASTLVFSPVLSKKPLRKLVPKKGLPIFTNKVKTIDTSPRNEKEVEVIMTSSSSSYAGPRKRKGSNSSHFSMNHFSDLFTSASSITSKNYTDAELEALHTQLPHGMSLESNLFTTLPNPFASVKIVNKRQPILQTNPFQGTPRTNTSTEKYCGQLNKSPTHLMKNGSPWSSEPCVVIKRQKLRHAAVIRAIAESTTKDLVRTSLVRATLQAHRRREQNRKRVCLRKGM